MSKSPIYLDAFVPGSGDLNAPIWCIGESPGFDECIYKVPFIGESGKILNDCLSRWGFSRNDVYVDNLCGYRPEGDHFSNLLGSTQLASGIKNIHNLIKMHRPTVVMACGAWPMHYTTKKGKQKKVKGKTMMSGIGHWRGSILPYIDDEGKEHEDIKVIPVFHPAYVSRNRSIYPTFDADIKRVANDSKFRGRRLPERNIICNPRGMELEHYTELLCREEILSIDIETIKGTTHILCIGFSPRPNFAVVIVPDSPEGIRSISRILYSKCKKVFHFGIFDTTVLKLNGYEISRDSLSVDYDRIYYWDTYLGAHVLEPELPKTLAYETSIRTREPYYKHEGKDEDEDQKGWSAKFDKMKLYNYCGKDVCCTIEVYNSQFEDFIGSDDNYLRTFSFELTELETQQHIAMAGMLVEQERLELFKKAMIARWAKLQFILNGFFKMEDVNVKSHPQMCKILYEIMGLPKRYKDKNVTADDDALVSLIGHCQGKINDSVKEETKRKYKLQLATLKVFREIREIRQIYSMYVAAKKSHDGRSRSLYKNGPETGRWAASKFVDGVGYNHQTNPRAPIEISDEDFKAYSDAVSVLEGQMVEDQKELSEMEDAA